MADRLTNLPESLQLRILSTLDAKYVVQTSVLSKSWFSLWKSVPILRLNSYDFENHFSKFDKFVEKVLYSQREIMDLDTLIYKRDKVSRAMILKKVIDYAFSHNVKHLDLWVDGVEGREWPVVLHGFVDSLISLRLQSDENNVRCSCLGPLSRSFRNLTDLYLKLAVITEQDPFSGFPMFPKLKTCDGLPNLDSVVVAFAGCSKSDDEKRMFDDLMMFFSKVYSVKSLKVCKGIVRILSLFQGRKCEEQASALTTAMLDGRSNKLLRSSSCKLGNTPTADLMSAFLKSQWLRYNFRYVWYIAMVSWLDDGGGDGDGDGDGDGVGNLVDNDTAL
ncbi:F-box/LRR-repeat protein-like protein [Tanacetum coccineum]